jgi:hypothetical protein
LGSGCMTRIPRARFWLLAVRAKLRICRSVRRVTRAPWAAVGR